MTGELNVKVKPLEWEEDGTALTPLGTRYSVYRECGRDRDCWAVNWLDGVFESVALAKAAAQADYEARILSALLPAAPEPDLVAEYERQEAVCTEAAMSQWEHSLKRPDLTEKDRVRGAIEAYKRQAFVFAHMPLPTAEEEPRSAIPAGWKLVPVEPTKEMLLAGFSRMDMSELGYSDLVEFYNDMLAAAPTPGHGQGGEG